MENDFTAIDIETTGLNPENNCIIEIGAVRYREGKPVKKFSQLINPGCFLPEPIIRLTGITDKMLVSAPNEETIFNDFIEFIGSDVILGHNILFDYSFLKVAALRNKYTFNKSGIDTLKICKKYHPELESRSLVNMCACYKIEQGSAHRAYHDAQTAAVLFLKLYEKFYSKSSPQVFEPAALEYQPKKQEPITQKQKKYLLDLIKYHKIKLENDIEKMTKSGASRCIDKIILEHGRMTR